MTALVVLLLIAVVVLAMRLRSESAKLREERARSQQLSARLEVAAKNANLDLQQRCAEQAAKAWKTGGWDRQKLATYENHYNDKLNKCFMRIENNINDSGAVYSSDRVIDAFGGKVYAELTWKLESGGNAMRCTALLPSGEQVQCTSPEEFDELAGQFMN